MWDPDRDEAGPHQRGEPVDLAGLADGRCKASSWRAPKPGRTTYEHHFGPGGWNRCTGHEGHANRLHKDHWGNVFQAEPFRVVRYESTQHPGAPAIGGAR